MNENVRVLKTEEEIKIITDPYRNRIIKALSQSIKPLTVTQIAEVMGEVPANVHYHLKKLLKINVIELDHIEVIKGINAKYYRLNKTPIKLTTPVSDNNESIVKKQMDTIKKFMYNEIDSFKDDIAQLEQFDVESSIPKGIFGKRDIYLSEEEFLELQALSNKFIQEKTVKDTKKQKYSVLLGVFIKDEKSIQ